MELTAAEVANIIEMIATRMTSKSTVQRVFKLTSPSCAIACRCCSAVCLAPEETYLVVDPEAFAFCVRCGDLLAKFLNDRLGERALRLMDQRARGAVSEERKRNAKLQKDWRKATSDRPEPRRKGAEQRYVGSTGATTEPPRFFRKPTDAATEEAQPSSAEGASILAGSSKGKTKQAKPARNLKTTSVIRVKPGKKKRRMKRF